MRVQGAPEPFSFPSQSAFQEAKREYKAGLDAALPNNRFMRNRRGLGGTGDYHLDAWQLWYVREVARHMVRCDAMPGQVGARLVDSLFAGGEFSIEPDTGDSGLDTELWNRFYGWGGDKRLCDDKGERVLSQLQWLLLFQEVMDGDIFGTFNDDGAVQLVEADRCVSPVTVQPGQACGIEMVAGRRVAFWFSKEQPLGPWGGSELIRREIYRPDGLQIAFQCYSAHRATQNRGYSWWHPVMIEAGMLDDLDFAMILKAQAAASVAGAIEQNPDTAAPNSNLGAETSQAGADGVTRTELAIKPGAFVELPAGKKLSGYTPNVPNPEHIEHVKHQLKKLGAAMHLPFIALLLDASETNFSGWRGAMDIVRQTWRRIQKDHIEQFLSPCWRWRAMRELPTLGAAAMKLWKQGTFLRHRCRPPRWRYIQPLQDAQADALMLAERLESPRGLAAERGRDFEDVMFETLADNAAFIKGAAAKAREINEEFPEAKANWREVSRWSIGSALSQSRTLEDDPDAAGAKPDKGGKR